MEKKRVTVPLICHGHSRPVVDLFYSPITPDGFFLISASKDANPMLRNGETGDWVGTFQGHKGAVWSCCLDTNALLAATASADFSAKVWDAITGDVKHSFDHKHIVRSCAFSEDTHLLLTGGMEKLLRIYDMNRPEAPPREVDKSPGSVRTVAWLHSDKSILSSCSDMGGLRLWDIRSGQIVRTLETKSSVTSTEVSRDGRYITTCDGTTVKFWDANNFGLVKSHEMNFIVESASLEPKLGNKFVAGGEDMWVRVFDFHTGTEIACNKGHHGPVHCVRFSPGGESYASGSEDGTIRIWQTGLSTIEETEPTANTGVEVKPAEEQVSQKNIVVEGNSTKEIPNVPDKKNHSTTDIEEPAAKTGVEIKPAEVQVSQKNIVEGNATKEILNVPDKRNSSTIAIKEPAANTSAKVKPAEVQVSQKNAVVKGNATKEIPNVPDKRNPSTTAIKEPAANIGVMVKPAEVQVSQKNVVVEGNSTKEIPNVPDKRNTSTTAIKEPAANTSVEVKPAEVKVSQKNVVEGNVSKEIPNVSDKRNPSTTDIKETVANTGPSPSVEVKSS